MQIHQTEGRKRPLDSLVLRSERATAGKFTETEDGSPNNCTSVLWTIELVWNISQFQKAQVHLQALLIKNERMVYCSYLPTHLQPPRLYLGTSEEISPVNKFEMRQWEKYKFSLMIRPWFLLLNYSGYWLRIYYWY